MTQIDVIIPYRNVDAHWLPSCVDQILAQLDVDIECHVINDGCPAQLDTAKNYATVPNVHRYRNTDSPAGAYVSTNRVVHHCQNDWLAIQDVDDTPFPNRLKVQLDAALTASADYSTASMLQYVDWHDDTDTALTGRRSTRPILSPGRKTASTPWGEIINGTLLIRKATFTHVNGYANWPCGADTDMANRLGASGATPCFLTQILAFRRIHSRSTFHGGHYGWGSPHRAQRLRDLQRLVAEYRSPNVDIASYGDHVAEYRSPHFELVD